MLSETWSHRYQIAKSTCPYTMNRYLVDANDWINQEGRVKVVSLLELIDLEDYPAIGGQGWGSVVADGQN